MESNTPKDKPGSSTKSAETEENPKVLPTFEDTVQKKAYIKEVLLDPNSHEDKSVKTEEQWQEKKHFENHPETTASLEFLKTHKEFQVHGRNPLRIPHDELQNALNGFTNMHLAHEIAVNHDFHLEVYNPPGNSLEERVRDQMKKAYWDIFDEAISSNDPNPAYALGVFREMKLMLLQLLLPHNRLMRNKIEAFLDESAIQYEVDHEILEIPKYTDFIVGILGQLCCPMRDKQILELKKLTKPSDVFKSLMHLMEQMQLDMANFLISQIRPTIINNCVEYERRKFANFIEVEYKLNEDALRVTRSWIQRHHYHDRTPAFVIGRAFAEVLKWDDKDWPETLTLDWARFTELAEETRRSLFLGTAILSAFNAARTFFGEDDEHLQPFERGNHYLLRCFPLRESLRMDLNHLIKKEDCESQEKLDNVMDLIAEQSVKITGHYLQKLMKRDIKDEEKDIIRRSVRDCAREDNAVRAVLLRRLQEYTTSCIATGKSENIDFPKSLMVIEEQVLRITVELSRIAVHNRAVFDDIYTAIMNDELAAPKFFKENQNAWDPSVLKAISLLTSQPSEKLVYRKEAINEKLVNEVDERGNLIPENEDLPYTETTPEIEAIIDKIIENTNIEDDFDEYANISEAEAVKLLQQLQRNDPLLIKRQMQSQHEAEQRIAAKKKKIREELQFQLKLEMGLPIYDKVSRASPGLRKFCRLLRAYDKDKGQPIEEAPSSPSEETEDVKRPSRPSTGSNNHQHNHHHHRKSQAP